MRRATRILTAVCVVTATATACGSTPATGQAPASVALGPTSTAADTQRPIQDVQLTPGIRYRFEDVVPDVLDVVLTAPTPALWDYHAPTVAVLSNTAAGDLNVLTFNDVDELRVPVDPYFSVASIASDQDYVRLSRDVPDNVLPYFAQLPFLATTRPIRPVTVAGNPGQVLDVAVRELPQQATTCAYGSLSKCAYISLLAAGFGQSVVSNQHYRIIDLQLPYARVLIIQDLDAPAAQTVLDSTLFVHKK